MRLSEYVEEAPHGEMARLARVAELSYATVWKLANTSYRLRDYIKAKALSQATGGCVSIAELCETDVEAAE